MEAPASDVSAETLEVRAFRDALPYDDTGRPLRRLKTGMADAPKGLARV